MEEIEQMRKKNQQLLEEKLGNVTYTGMDQWFKKAVESVDDDTSLIIASSGAFLPSWGAGWSGLIVVDTSSNTGKASFNDITGRMGFGTSPVVVKAGSTSLPEDLVDRLLKLFERHRLRSFKDVPQKCYDGSPVTSRIRFKGEEAKASVNIGDGGAQPAMKLGRLICTVLEEIDFKEVSRYEPPEDGRFARPWS